MRHNIRSQFIAITASLLISGAMVGATVMPVETHAAPVAAPVTASVYA